MHHPALKKILMLLFGVSLTLTVLGQAGKQSFELSAGAMFPLSDLSDNNLSDSSSGASATGYHLQVSYDYLLSDHFGLGIDVEFNDARYSMNKVHKYYDGILDDARKEITSTNGWTIGGIYMRYFIRFPLGNSVSLDVSPLIGGMGIYSPAYSITRTSLIPPGPNPSYTYTRQRSKTFSFAYGINTKVNIKVNHHGLFIEGRVLRSKVNFKQVTGTGFDGRKYDQSIKMDILYITASVGYAYYF